MSEEQQKVTSEEAPETAPASVEGNESTGATTTKTKNNTAATDIKTSSGSKKPLAKKQTKKKATGAQQIRGLPKSGRPWKTPKEKFSTIKKTTHRLSFEKKTELRNQLRHIKEMSRNIKEQRKEAAVQKNQRRIENAERRLANERRAEVVQVIKNTSKLKRMKKKQMRMIEKRDISQVKVV
ncbi:coiled-coil domain-containing protein 86 [Anastrepha ludens]|uniref:coiled-coil domain-containing protein 86 n=1 Tax=Anastrepha ludens TaxID=28586 RepID=UPI0023B02AF0|nr:coiled-coil domain-containing protein 86 [Anastrepha ludens]